MSLKRQEVRLARTKSQIRRTHGSDSYEHEPRNKAQRELNKLIIREELNNCIKGTLITCLCDECCSEQPLEDEYDNEHCRNEGCSGIPDDSHGYCRYCIQDLLDDQLEAMSARSWAPLAEDSHLEMAYEDRFSDE